MTLNDLDDAGIGAEPAGAPVDPARVRRLVLVVLTVAGLLALTGSAAAAPARVRALWTTAFRPSDAVAVDGGTVYLNRSVASGPAEVFAYDLPTGRPRWS